MTTRHIPFESTDDRRVLAWAAAAIGGTATLGAAWKTVLLTVAVALGGCAALPF